jgi:hypothetical protein
LENYFPKAAIYHLGAVNSYHSPILLNSNPTDPYSPRPFRFEALGLRIQGAIKLLTKLGKRNFMAQLVIFCIRSNKRLQEISKCGIEKSLGTARE